MKPTIVVHGGAWDWPDEVDALKHNGLSKAVEIGLSLLKEGGSAIDAVAAAACVLEDDPIFDAGTGGYLNQQGTVELDALICDGATINFGAVAGVTNVKNPILLARKILENTEHNFFIGSGAEALAREFDLSIASNEILATSAMKELYAQYQASQEHDTIGAVAIDSRGSLAVATSTSGSPVKPEGRVGDSPIFGSGGYADNLVGAAGATGLGEQIMRLLLARNCCAAIESGANTQAAVVDTISRAEQQFENALCGLIAIDSLGTPAAFHSTPKMGIGWADAHGQIRTAMHCRDFTYSH